MERDRPGRRWAFRCLLLGAALLAGAPTICGRPYHLQGMIFIDTEDGGFFVDAYEYPNQAGVRPRYETNLADARKACAAQGKRLCTDAEWRRACSGPSGVAKYGYGTHYRAGHCNTGKQLTSGHSGIPMDPENISPSGALKQCRTKEGVYDLVGNVEEWVLSSWQDKAAILEGGAWFTIVRYASCSGLYSRQPHYRVNPKVLVYSAGFRCCWSHKAPTEAHLTRAALTSDTRRRLAAARATVTKKPYDPHGEVQLAKGMWIDRFEYPNRVGEFPNVGVSWVDANKACKKEGKRLCTLTEWEMACEGKSGNRYSYSSSYQSDQCGVDTNAPVVTGGHRGCVSPVGAVDMVGGVWEWTASLVDTPPGTFEKGTVLRAVRGGSWYSDRNDGVCRPFLGYTAAPQTAVFSDLGFRCCRGKVYRDPMEKSRSWIRCPKDMVAIRNYCIDRYEHPNKKGGLPAIEVNFNEAVKACQKRKLHVCTEKEWEAACMGPARRHWPYGDKYVATRCRHGLVGPGESNPAVPSGSYDRCATPDGIFDMCGNVWEWTVTPEGSGVLRGGGVNVIAGFCECSSRAKASHTYQSFETGVRCCATEREARDLVGHAPPPPPPPPPGAGRGKGKGRGKGPPPPPGAAPPPPPPSKSN